MELDVDIVDGPKWRAGKQVSLFEGRASADTSVEDGNTIINPLVDALFSTFPGPNGVTQRVEIELK